MMAGIWGGLIMRGIYAVVAIKNRVPSLLAFAWPALFVSLGWNFLDSGIDPPGAAARWCRSRDLRRQVALRPHHRLIALGPGTG